jgi:hypothetical protein
MQEFNLEGASALSSVRYELLFSDEIQSSILKSVTCSGKNPLSNLRSLFNCTRYFHYPSVSTGLHHASPTHFFSSLKKYEFMEKIYANRLRARLGKTFVLSLLFLAASSVSIAQIYTTRLSGAIEAPPNASPATGTATVTIDGNFMRLQTSFSGLLGLTTAAHIHAPTPMPGTGTAGVATTLPTFPGFPAGVQAASYDRTFDMTLASSYNPAFITANGGTPLTAFGALKAALNNGTSYLNIHTNVFLGGEIRGFLVRCAAINVSIPDAFALAQGTLPNTVYPAYAPAASLMLTANVSGGTGPYTYSWSNGATSASTTVSPGTTTVYSVTVLDQAGCPGTATKTVNVVNIADGKKGDKILVCHNGNSLSIAAPAVAAHLSHGDMLGRCSGAGQTVAYRNNPMEQSASLFSVKALPNPSSTYFNLQLNGEAGDNIQIRVYDILGRVVETKISQPSMQTLRIGSHYKAGVYLVEIVKGTERQTIRLIKSK